MMETAQQKVVGARETSLLKAAVDGRGRWAVGYGFRGYSEGRNIKHAIKQWMRERDRQSRDNEVCVWRGCGRIS